MEKDSLCELLGEPEAARKLGVSPSTLKRRRQLRLPPIYVPIGARIFYRARDLQSLIEQSLVKPEENAAA
jgi:hypothetical protein